jgi:hypothetical protein
LDLRITKTPALQNRDSSRVRLIRSSRRNTPDGAMIYIKGSVRAPEHSIVL